MVIIDVSTNDCYDKRDYLYKENLLVTQFVDKLAERCKLINSHPFMANHLLCEKTVFSKN